MAITTKQSSIAFARNQMSESNITLRPVGPDDYDFLVEVYGSTRADELALVPWTDEQRYAFVRSQFNSHQDQNAKTYPGASHDVIMSDGRRVGRLYVARLDQEIRIIDITLLPAERNAGSGVERVAFELSSLRVVHDLIAHSPKRTSMFRAPTRARKWALLRVLPMHACAKRLPGL